jgi:hypothetical protein
MEAGLANTPWSIADLCELIEAKKPVRAEKREKEMILKALGQNFQSVEI